MFWEVEVRDTDGTGYLGDARENQKTLAFSLLSNLLQLDGFCFIAAAHSNFVTALPFVFGG